MQEASILYWVRKEKKDCPDIFLKNTQNDDLSMPIKLATSSNVILF
ncbi:MAG TPA: hypothetical protein VIK89_15495 [Cytophagaceae bacterium]